MLFNANTIISSSTVGATSLLNYTLLPIISIGFIMAIVIAVILIAYHWIIKRGISGAAGAIGVHSHNRRRYVSR